jgi:hypothetical protein
VVGVELVGLCPVDVVGACSACDGTATRGSGGTALVAGVSASVGAGVVGAAVVGGAVVGAAVSGLGAGVGVSCDDGGACVSFGACVSGSGACVFFGACVSGGAAAIAGASEI